MTTIGQRTTNTDKGEKLDSGTTKMQLRVIEALKQQMENYQKNTRNEFQGWTG